MTLLKQAFVINLQLKTLSGNEWAPRDVAWFGLFFCCPSEQFKLNVCIPRSFLFSIIIGDVTLKASCQFGKLSEVSKASNGQNHKENYLDGTKRFFTNHNVILQRIKQMMKEKLCKAYSLFTNNCEHLATYVRYGKEMSQQVCNRINSITQTCSEDYETDQLTGYLRANVNVLTDLCCLIKVNQT